MYSRSSIRPSRLHACACIHACMIEFSRASSRRPSAATSAWGRHMYIYVRTSRAHRGSRRAVGPHPREGRRQRAAPAGPRVYTCTRPSRSIAARARSRALWNAYPACAYMQALACAHSCKHAYLIRSIYIKCTFNTWLDRTLKALWPGTASRTSARARAVRRSG